MTTLSAKELDVARAALRVIADAIRDTGATGMPSGILYGMLMEFGISFETYCKIITGFKTNGWVRESADVLYWIA